MVFEAKTLFGETLNPFLPGVKKEELKVLNLKLNKFMGGLYGYEMMVTIVSLLFWFIAFTSCMSAKRQKEPSGGPSLASFIAIEIHQVHMGRVIGPN